MYEWGLGTGERTSCEGWDDELGDSPGALEEERRVREVVKGRYERDRDREH